MTSIFKILTLENPVLCGYLTYGSVLVLKMMLMSVLTVKQRLKQGIPASSEDAVFYNGKAPKRTDENIERVRRAHLNDLESIPIFFLVGFSYMLTDPDPTRAINLFRLFAAARCLHTFVYAICIIPQPARGIVWGVGYAITGYMAMCTICYFKAF